MKIVQVITLGDVYYGAQKHVFDLATHLAIDGHEVIVITGTYGVLNEKLKNHHIESKILPSLGRSINPFKDITSIYGLIKILKNIQPDVVASHSSKAGMISRIACRICKTPNTFTAHGWSFETGKPFVTRSVYLVIEFFISKLSSKIITVCNDGFDLALKNRIGNTNTLVTIPYGISDHALSLVFNRKATDVCVNLIMVAGFREQKDHLTLFKALALIKLIKNNWNCYLLGHGELFEQVKRLAETMGLKDNIRFEGAVENVGEYLSKSHIMVLSTNWEGLPISIMEGLSYALPIVATDVSGVSEEVIDGRNGYLTKPKDYEGLAEKILDLMDNVEKRNIFGQNSRNLFLKHFTMDKMYQSTLKLYEEINQKP